jgi:hypothetical protein
LFTPGSSVLQRGSEKVKTLALILLLAKLPCVAQNRSVASPVPDSKAEALVVCGLLLRPEPLTPYGFAKATLVSLWYAQSAAEHSNEIKQAARETDNSFSLMTAMMRITKTSTNDFICAKRSLQPFTAKQKDENIRTAADFLMVVYDAHISINQRILDILKKLGSTDQGELMDQISTLQVERGQRWADLVQPTTLAAMLMVDLKRTDEIGKTTRLVITKAQKQILLDWANDHFPEFNNGTPKEQWSVPAKTARVFFLVFERRKCSDE